MKQATIQDKIESVMEKYERYWSEPEALAEVKSLWGVGDEVNDCGVFINYETETVAKTKQGEAHVGIYKVSDSVFVHCCGYWDGTDGFGYAPSVWKSETHTTEGQAKDAAIAELINRIAGGELKAQLTKKISQPSLF